jgi:hypothetical protein
MTPILGILASAISGNLTPVLPVTANLQGWWDPSDSSSVTLSSGKVSQLNDKSGNSRHMVQATGANQPTYSTAAKNGRNAMQFSGSQWLEPSSNWSQTDLTFFIVVKFDNTSPQTSTGYTNYKLMVQTNGQGGGANWTYQMEPGGPGTYFFWEDGAANTNWNYFEVVRPDSGSTAIGTVNNGGSWAGIGGNGSLQALGSGKLTIGRRQDTALPMTGYIGEVLQYSGQMSSTDRTSVKSYLASKWGI